MTVYMMTGVSGVGKTTISKYLSIEPNVIVVSYSDFLSKMQNFSISEIDTEFVNYVNKLDNDKIHMIVDSRPVRIENEDYVVTPFSKKNIKTLNPAKIFYVDASPEQIYKRILNDSKPRKIYSLEEIEISRKINYSIAEWYFEITEAELIIIKNDDLNKALETLKNNLLLHFNKDRRNHNIDFAELNSDVESDDYRTRWFAWEVLGSIKDEALVEFFEHYLAKDESVADVILWGLGQMKSEKSISKIIPFLDHPDEYYVHRAAESLRDIGRASVKSLINYLESSDNKIGKRHAVWALGEIGDPSAYEILWKHIFDEDKYVSWESTKSLIKLGPVIIDKLINNIINSEMDDYAAWRAIFILGNITSLEKYKDILENLDVGKYPKWLLYKFLDKDYDEIDL